MNACLIRGGRFYLRAAKTFVILIVRYLSPTQNFKVMRKVLFILAITAAPYFVYAQRAHFGYGLALGGADFQGLTDLNKAVSEDGFSVPTGLGAAGFQLYYGKPSWFLNIDWMGGKYEEFKNNGTMQFHYSGSTVNFGYNVLSSSSKKWRVAPQAGLGCYDMNIVYQAPVGDESGSTAKFGDNTNLTDIKTKEILYMRGGLSAQYRLCGGKCLFKKRALWLGVSGAYMGAANKPEWMMPNKQVVTDVPLKNVNNTNLQLSLTWF
jgi:hypothetical protein